MSGRNARGRPLTWELVEAFVASRKARGCSPRYVEWLRYCLRFMGRVYVRVPERVEELELVLATVKGSDETRVDVWRALRVFFRFAAERYGVEDVARKIPKPRGRRNRKVIRTLEPVQVERLLWACRRRPRDYALVMLLLDTGARVGEVHSLTWGNVLGDANEGYRVRLTCGKTGEREVPVSDDTLVALKRGCGLGALWVDRRGRELTVSGLQRVVRRALARVDVTGGPHLLRHTFGRLYILNGGDVVSLQIIMGHSQVSTTRRYLDLDLRDVQRQHARYSPVAVRAMES